MLTEIESALRAPGPNDDAARGYKEGWRWIDRAAHKLYVCLDPAPGAAVWQEEGGGGAGISQSTLDTALLPKANASDVAALTDALATTSAALAGKVDQAALAGKADLNHTHAIGAITGAGTAAAANISDFDPAGAAAAVQAAAISALAGKAPAVHTHAIADTTGLQSALDGKASSSDPRLSDARAPTAHTHPQADVTGLAAALAGKAPTSHTHATSEVTGLDNALLSKAPAARVLTAGAGLSGGGDLTADRSLAVSFGSAAGTAAQGNDARLSDARTPLAHTHPQSDITGLVAALAGKQDTAGKGAASGYASLDAATKLPLAQLPSHQHPTSDITGYVAPVNSGLLVPLGLYAGSLAGVTAFVSGTMYAVYLGRCPVAVTSATVLLKVTTAGVTITWAEAAIFRGSLVPNAGASLTRLGFANVAAVVNSLGTKAVVVTLSGMAAGDELWLAIGAQATTMPVFRAMLADDVQSGVLQSAAVRPSLTTSPQATLLAAATLAPPWCSVRV